MGLKKGYNLLVAVLGLVALTAFNVWFTASSVEKSERRIEHVIKENNKQTCALYSLIYQPTPESPIPDPNDPLQKRSAAIREELGILLDGNKCPDGRDPR